MNPLMEQLSLVGRALESRGDYSIPPSTLGRIKILRMIDENPGVTTKEISIELSIARRRLQGIVMDMRDTDYITGEPIGKGRTLAWAITAKGRAYYRHYE